MVKVKKAKSGRTRSMATIKESGFVNGLCFRETWNVDMEASPHHKVRQRQATTARKRTTINRGRLSESSSALPCCGIRPAVALGREVDQGLHRPRRYRDIPALAEQRRAHPSPPPCPGRAGGGCRVKMQAARHPSGGLPGVEKKRKYRSRFRPRPARCGRGAGVRRAIGEGGRAGRAGRPGPTGPPRLPGVRLGRREDAPRRPLRVSPGAAGPAR